MVMSGSGGWLLHFLPHCCTTLTQDLAHAVLAKGISSTAMMQNTAGLEQQAGTGYGAWRQFLRHV